MVPGACINTLADLRGGGSMVFDTIFSKIRKRRKWSKKYKEKREETTNE